MTITLILTAVWTWIVVHAAVYALATRLGWPTSYSHHPYPFTHAWRV